MKQTQTKKVLATLITAPLVLSNNPVALAEEAQDVAFEGEALAAAQATLGSELEEQALVVADSNDGEGEEQPDEILCDASAIVLHVDDTDHPAKFLAHTSKHRSLTLL